MRLISFLLIASLSSCGFQLRGSGDSAAITGPVYVTSQGFSEIARELRLVLKNSDIPLSEKPANAVLQVDIEREQTDSRALTIGTDTRVRDIEVIYLVRLTVKRTGDDGATPEDLRATREFTFDVSGVLGSSDEEELLFEEMRRELVNRVLSRLVLLSQDNSG